MIADALDAAGCLSKARRMSKISISAATACQNIEAIQLIRSVTGHSIDSIRKKLAAGKSGSVYTTELYRNDHVKVDAEIRTLIHGLRSLGIPIFVAEIPYDEQWDHIESMDDFGISDESLIALLDEAVGKFA
ncbi:hypothetical protein [Lysobacter brunescens]